MAKELTITLVQSPLFWENPERNREMFSKKLDAISNEVDLIILPEMFTTAFTMQPKNIKEEEGIKTVKWMQRQAAKKNAALVGSMVFQEDGRYFNRLHFVEPDGGFHTYDKRHTFTLAGEDKVYNAGEKKVLVEYKGFRFYPLICYDLRFPVWSRNTENYDALLYVANWPKPRITAWDTLLRARAIENMAYCIGVNRIGQDDTGHAYVGHSAVYDCLGNQLVFSDKETVLHTTLRKEHIETTRNKLKFLDDRDHFILE
ncbi:amidohydrolase [Ulvibacterium sp.]|uniref:amidohydrolase n=1 Tax=Ulvibacterium sp. TaxID=2665914 RepID=UPI00261CE08D|nr:amidohydrolase [Ulvibacterium sp.]